MKALNKTISLILSISIILMCCVNASLSALADDNIKSGSCGSGLSYVLASNGTLTISGSGRMDNYYNTDNGRAPWYSNRSKIKNVVIQSDVKTIGSSAFYNCKSIVDVDFGSIDTIGAYAFQYCEKLDSAMLPTTCTYIWNNAFEGCISLRKAYIERIDTTSSLNRVPAGFFKNCSSLSVIGLGTGIHWINTTGSFSALDGCKNLKTIISDNGNIKSAFENTYNVIGWSERSGECSDNTYSNQKLTWNYSLNDERLWFTGSGDMNYYPIGQRPWDMFDNVIKYIDFSQTNGICTTTSDSFKDCKSIETLDLTNVREIGWRSFGDCAGLKTIDFGSVLESIWDWAFERCYALDHIVFKEGSSPLRIRHHAFYQCKNTTYWLNFPSNISQIDEYAFNGTKFNYITFSNTQKVEIGDNAFGTNDRDFYLRMLGPAGVDNGVFSYVREMKDKYRYNWFYYCNGNHQFVNETIAPTCTKDGYKRYGCKYCMTNEYKSDFVAKTGHSYQITGESDGNIKYRCTVCGDENHSLSSIELSGDFAPAISTVAGEYKFNQNNYTSKVDMNCDGVINAKDFVMIRKAMASIETTNKETTIDPARTYQEIEGFGASACWWSQEVGQWENAEEIMEMLYSEENGIGLDIYRYNLGAGSEDQKDYGLYNGGARTHCFMKNDGTYDWNNDPGAMNCLDLAQQFNPNLKVTLFSNSAPYFMTKNGKTYATQEMQSPSNLDSSKYQEFADFTATCAEHFIDEGYNVTEISPINEPEWNWQAWRNGDGSQSHGQEGCHFEWYEARDFYNNYMVPTLRNHSKLNGKVELAVWECAQLNHQWLFNNFIDNLFSSKDYDSLDRWGRKQGSGFAANNENIRNYTNYLDTHSYWCSEDDRHVVADTLADEFYGQKVKCSEYCQMTNDANTGVLGHIQNEGSTNGMTIDYGLAMADIMYQDFTILNAVEWDWWTACAKGVYPDNLILINANNHSDVQTSKRYWCMGNFSKYIDVGAKRIQVDVASGFAQNLHTDRVYHWTFHDDNDNISNEGDDKNNYIEQLAFLNPDGSTVVIYINNSDTIEYTRIQGGNYSSFSTYVTSETMNLKNFQNGSVQDAVCIPARSLTTVVLK